MCQHLCRVALSKLCHSHEPVKGMASYLSPSTEVARIFLEEVLLGLDITRGKEGREMGGLRYLSIMRGELAEDVLASADCLAC